MRQCSVPGCKLENQAIHRFPFNENLGKVWLRAIGDVNLSKMPYDLIRQKGLVVCGLHFTDSSYQLQATRNLLKAYAVPTLRLSAKETDPQSGNNNSIPDANSDNTRTREPPRERSPLMTQERRLKINEDVDSYLRLKSQIDSKNKSAKRRSYSTIPTTSSSVTSSSALKNQIQQNKGKKLNLKRQWKGDIESSKVLIPEKRRKVNKSVPSSSVTTSNNVLNADVNATIRITSSANECLSEEIVIVDEHLTQLNELNSGELSPPVTSFENDNSDSENLQIEFDSSNAECSNRALNQESTSTSLEKIDSQAQCEGPTDPDSMRNGEHRTISTAKKGCKTNRTRLTLGRSLDKKSLTPKANQIFGEATEIRKSFYSSRRKVKRLEKKLNDSRKSLQIADRIEKLSKPQRLFVDMQLKNVDIKAKGRRFSDEEKVLALSIFKKSPTAYNHLTHLFTLPSKPVLMKFLSAVPLDTGINNSIVDHLTEIGGKSEKVDKQFSMCWDEAHVHPHVAYDLKKNKIIGFEDTGNHRSSEFADHVIVFMTRRLSDGAKAPFSYYYTHSQMKYGKLIECIRENIKALDSTGLKLVVTICDQGSSNIKAIQELRKEYLKECGRRGVEPGSEVEMTVEGVTFIAVLDIPHIVKGMRNNLLKKPLSLGDGELVKWEHFQIAFELDNNVSKPVLSLPKIKEGHVYEDKMPKMKVCVAAQVLSNSISRFISTTCQYNIEIQTPVGPLKMPADAIASAKFANLMDTTFDSLNGTSDTKNFEKPLRNVVSRNTGHVDHWNKARREFKKMFFITESNQQLPSPPSLKNLIWNLEAMPQLWKNLQVAGFTEFKPGYVNQDILENFFGMLRSHSHRFVNLTCFQVDGLFKTLLLNNLTSRHSLSSNCLDDGTDALQSLGNFLITKRNEASTRVPGPDGYHEENELKDTTLRRSSNRLGNFAWLRYAGGFLSKLRRNLSCLQNCQECEKIFYAPVSRDNEIAAIKEPSREGPRRVASADYFERGFVSGMSIVRRKLNVIAFQCRLKQKLANFVSRRIDFEWVTCREHKQEIKEKFLNLLITENIFNWCNHINRLLSGQQKKHGNSLLEQKAKKLYEVTRKRKAAMDKIKKAQYQRSQSSRGTNSQCSS